MKRLVRERPHLLDGITPEAASLFKDHQVSLWGFSISRRSSFFCQIEANEIILFINRPDGLLKKQASSNGSRDVAFDRNSSRSKTQSTLRLAKKLDANIPWN
ncbi:hypothetical protein [Paraburkholderia sartisoli]|uniref:hypothetical protein n=1 Tax=Paraburkholderia sartisoli TaxID=83784 RepID=UPI0011608F31|nr:hypothetical protein [Paraburkholderia sartisoli]